MVEDWRYRLRALWWIALLLILLGGYWLLPISGEVVVITGEGRGWLWPRVVADSSNPIPGDRVTVWVTDVQPWTYVLLTVNGRPAQPETWRGNPGGTWTWEWTFTVPEEANQQPLSLVFYHDCDTGCVERARFTLGEGEVLHPSAGTPTKLCLAFPNPARDWHGRSGWVVDLTYARAADDPYWGVDALAERVYLATARGLRVLVRVDYDRGQSLPPVNDNVALTEYLAYLQRLARDARLRAVYAYFLGSGYNAADANALAPDRPVTPVWYARVFSGYGEPVTHTDNAVQVMREENPRVRVLVGPVRPWVWDQDGERYAIDVPWLNYMNTLVAYLDEATRAKAAAGIPLAVPDGFALHVPGRPGAPELAGRDPAQEPRLDLRRDAWKGAQAGFRIYRDWLAIINAYPTTRGLPAYITSTNTFAPDEGIPPAQNYPPGWLTTALEVINEEPQVRALCWFLDDIPGDVQWQWFNLTRRPGRLIYAAEEFEKLLQE